MKSVDVSIALNAKGTIRLLVPKEWDNKDIDDYVGDPSGLEFSAIFYMEDNGEKLNIGKGIKSFDIEEGTVHPTKIEIIK